MGSESEKDVALFLEVIILACCSVVFLLATVHVDALLAGAQSRFADDMFFSPGVGVLDLA
ncbi:hypothetical protein K0M31_006709 [Melipona bicolor]|uniref:Uncharacterized protein n=1 Tax=Melipona bicolor TaxID=60889 RepID=A0AA40FS33_9HYME|nr:hypothetical protein K0M31_006709 [Melipona bicolor]